MQWNDPKLHALLEDATKRGYHVVLDDVADAAPAEAGPRVYTARLYCLHDYTRDCEASAETPALAVESVVRRADGLSAAAPPAA